MDQTRLPGDLIGLRIADWREAAEAIAAMRVRGAPLIGATAAYGMALATRSDPSELHLEEAAGTLRAARPTAVNLSWAVRRVLECLRGLDEADRPAAAYREAQAICEEDVAANRAIGVHGAKLIRELATRNHGRPVRIMTHCNAGRLATVAWGTATAPIYRACDGGVPVHVFVSETRPRNQGLLTAWELSRAGVEHTILTDSACGHLLARGAVDCCIVGTDRTTANGDVANKIGTYLKALAAREAGVPFWVALPSSSIDWSIDAGARIPIEERAPGELRAGWGPAEVLAESAVANPAFDVTPGRLIDALITERGVTTADREGLEGLFPDTMGEIA